MIMTPNTTLIVAKLLMMATAGLPFAYVVFRRRELLLDRFPFILITLAIFALWRLEAPPFVAILCLAAYGFAAAARCNAMNISRRWRLLYSVVPPLQFLAWPILAVLAADGIPNLHLAAADGNLERLKMELEKGLSVNDRDKKGGTPLMYASRNGRIDVAAWLIQHGADINIRLDTGETALSIAKSHGHQSVADLIEARQQVSPDDSEVA